MSERTMARTDASTKNDFRHPTRPVTPSLVPHAVSRGEVLRAQWDLRDIGLDAPPDRIAAAVREADAEHGDGHVTTPAEVRRSAAQARVRTDNEAQRHAAAFHSHGLSQGRDVWVGRGSNAERAETVAHEFVHVVRAAVSGDKRIRLRVAADPRSVEFTPGMIAEVEDHELSTLIKHLQSIVPDGQVSASNPIAQQNLLALEVEQAARQSTSQRHEERRRPTAFGPVSTPSSKSNSVGEPGFGESLIPVWGSGRSAVAHFQRGNIGRGLLYSALAVTDVFLVKSLVTAGGKVLVKGAAKVVAEEGVELAGKQIVQDGAEVATKEMANEGAVVGSKEAAEGAVAVTSRVFDAAAEARILIAATTELASNGAKMLAAGKILSAKGGMSALEKSQVMLEFLRSVGFIISGAGVRETAEFVVMHSEDEMYAFRFMKDTAKVWFGKFALATFEYVWRIL